MTLSSHPRRRIGAALAGLLAATALVVGSSAGAVAAPPSQPVVSNLVALGDSYAAGQGAAAPLDGCLRSTAAYPVLMDAVPKLNLLRTAACSGATIEDVMTTQLSQVNRGTTLVTITAGANDLGVGAVYAACAPNPYAPACYQAIGAAEAALPGIAPSISALVLAVAERAPNARIIVTDYPIPFNAGQDTLLQGVNYYTLLLNQYIAAGVAGAAGTGVDVGLASVMGIFAGHAAGDADAWIGANPADPFTFLHPTAAGQAAYSQVVLAAR